MGGNTGALGPRSPACSPTVSAPASPIRTARIYSHPTYGTWAIMNGPIRTSGPRAATSTDPSARPPDPRPAPAASALRPSRRQSPRPDRRAARLDGRQHRRAGPAITGVLTYGLGSGVAYQNGSIFSHPTYGTWAIMNGPIRDEWTARGYFNGPLGWPTGPQTCVAGVCSDLPRRQSPRPDRPAVRVDGRQHRRPRPRDHRRAHLRSRLGRRLSERLDLLPPPYGTWAITNGPIRNEWTARGYFNGHLGWPTGPRPALPASAVRPRRRQSPRRSASCTRRWAATPAPSAPRSRAC